LPKYVDLSILFFWLDFRLWKEANPGKDDNEFPPAWKLMEWDTFVWLGAPGSNEPHLLPEARDRTGRSSGAPARAQTKKRRANRAAQAQTGIDAMGDMPDAEEHGICDVATPLGMPSGSGTSGGTSVGYDVRRKGASDATDLEFVEGLRAMKTGMDQHMQLMASFRDTDKLRAKMETIKLLLAHFPPGTPEYVKALEGLSAMSEMED